MLAHEHDNRGEALRALVLCDAELASQRPDDALTGVLDPAAGTARHALLALAADDRTAHLRPLLVSGRGLRCHPNDAEVLLEALQAAAEDRFKLPEWEAEPDGLLVSLQSRGAEWMPRAWVELATALLVEGTTGVLVGTRALLGEGWNCPPLNVLVDMTIATTGVSVQQMRGRSLRLDPDDPLKVASNWDIVCVAPDLVRGSADYERFVRKHLNLFAPAEDGEVEAGPVARAPGARPVRRRRRSSASATLNRELLARAADRDGARERWQIGTPYRGVELPTLLVRRRRRHAPPPRRRHRPGAPLHLSQRVPIASGLGGGAAFGVLGVATSAPPLLVGLALAPAGLGLGRRAAARRQEAAAARAPARRRRARGGRGLPRAGRAVRRRPRVADDRAAHRRLPALRAGRGDARRGQAVRAALDELVGVSDAPRYLVSRPLADPRRGAIGLLGRVLTRRAAVRGAPAPRARRPRPQQGARRGLRARLAPARRAGPARLHPAHRGRPRGARRGGFRRRRLRDAGERRLGLSERVLGRVLAVLGGAVGGVGARSPGAERQCAQRAAASSEASRQACSTGLHSGSRRSTISNVSGTSSRRVLRSPVVIGRSLRRSAHSDSPDT